MSDISTYDYKNDNTLSEKWKFRFAFYEKNGYPGFWKMTPAWKSAFKEIGFWQKRRVSMNLFAYAFSFIYLMILGLWKKATLVLVLNLVTFIVAVLTGLGPLMLVVNGYIGWRANIWYYEYKVKGIQTWSL
ncbi:DUF2628 domain-containing protein [Enterobacter sp. Bisph1]|uniref:DUF2628 domain-containing protein n=1 Tax=Enterobacter sp. Bisph1 TaxID=1274399 RepID=UPI00057C013F|nr:DUF2628 domain-containing protein [Enterobacter sp. Bisph1]